MVKACLPVSLSDTGNAKKQKARDVVFQVLRFQGLVLSFSVANNVDTNKNKENLAQTEENFLKRMERTVKLEILCCRMSADVSVLRFQGGEREEE